MGDLMDCTVAKNRSDMSVAFTIDVRTCVNRPPTVKIDPLSVKYLDPSTS